MVGYWQLGGIQLIADKTLESELVRFYQIIGIPRSVQIDPNSRFLDFRASSLSSDQLERQIKKIK
jgi:hypothetical protein